MSTIDHDVNPLHLRYLAGFFDARGSISVGCITRPSGATTGVYGGRERHYQLKVKVSGRTREAPDLFRAAFGGTVAPHRSAGAITSYNWVGQSHYAEQTLRALLPYLRLKREQSALAIEFADDARRFSAQLKEARQQHRQEQQRSSAPHRLILTNDAILALATRIDAALSDYSDRIAAFNTRQRSTADDQTLDLQQTQPPAPAPLQIPTNPVLPPPGDMVYNAEATRVQCHVCGEYHGSLGAHIKRHGLSAQEYRHAFGIPTRQSLSAPHLVARKRVKNTPDAAVD